MRNVIIGADGGGTKTNLVALDAATGRKVAAAATGSINIYFAGMAAAVSNMKAALAALELQKDDRIDRYSGTGFGSCFRRGPFACPKAMYLWLFMPLQKECPEP